MYGLEWKPYDAFVPAPVHKVKSDKTWSDVGRAWLVAALNYSVTLSFQSLSMLFSLLLRRHLFEFFRVDCACRCGHLVFKRPWAFVVVDNDEFEFAFTIFVCTTIAKIRPRNLLI